jgi:H+/Cl- antiporter ClcA
MNQSKVVAGLPCGKEGPMIHSGAIVGAMATPPVGSLMIRLK